MIKDKYDSIFIDNFLMLRKLSALTQEQIANYLNVTRSRVGAWCEKRAAPPMVCKIKICELFGVKLERMHTEVLKIKEAA